MITENYYELSNKKTYDFCYPSATFRELINIIRHQGHILPLRAGWNFGEITF